MITRVTHISSRCGSGKSYHTLHSLLDRLCHEYPQVSRVIFASKTTRLNDQNHQVFAEAFQACKHPKKKFIKLIRVDSDTHPGQVTRVVSDTLRSPLNGVIFTSHAVLNNLDPLLLKGVELILDEIPSSLVATLSVQYEASDQGNDWEGNVLTRPSQHPGFEEAYLTPHADIAAIRRVISNIRSNRDNTRTRPVADLLAFLLANYDTLYVSVMKSRRSFRNYQAVQWLPVKQIVEQVASLTLLCAQLKDSLFGFVLQYCLKLKIDERHQIGKTQLETRHPHQVVIYPFLKQGRWSNQLKQELVCDAICTEGGQLVNSKLSVVEYAQQQAEAIMFNDHSVNEPQEDPQPYVAILNKRDPVREELFRENIALISSISPGMNHLSNHQHALYLASNLPNPYELKYLKVFALDHGALSGVIEHAVLVERCYESAYQCVARTRIRSLHPQANQVHSILVPDLYYAKYLKRWFKPGAATIDQTKSYITRVTQNRAEEHQRVYDITVQILKARQHQKNATFEQLVESYPISMSTFNRCKRVNRSRFEELGLIKPKRNRPGNEIVF